VKGKKGPIRINFIIPPRCESEDFAGIVCIDKDASHYEDKSCFYKFQSKKNVIVLNPKSLPVQVWQKSDDFSGSGSIDKNTWPL